MITVGAAATSTMSATFSRVHPLLCEVNRQVAPGELCAMVRKVFTSDDMSGAS